MRFVNIDFRHGDVDVDQRKEQRLKVGWFQEQTASVGLEEAWSGSKT
jgi:hypothetical protein